ncbi:MAG: LysM peptidoglycan-binding domain-containing protein [Clostridia bacterium]|nr:LysM peptidoglycan-binding domain-containing protein [Clostridia bacterium]
MKIVNKRKFITSLLLILLIISILSLIVSKSTYSCGEKQYKTIYVSTGDTLWNIANFEAKSNSYYKNKDLRYIIDDIIRINNLANSNINVDQKLLIPTI